MGRKSRKRVKKTSLHETDSEPEDTEEYIFARKREAEYDHICLKREQNMRIYNEMMEYITNNGLSLCEYMDIESFIDFTNNYTIENLE